MSRYVNKKLIIDEGVVFETNYHWIQWFSFASLLTLGLYPTIQSLTDEFVVTNRRIIKKKGIMLQYTLEMNISRVETVKFH